MMLCEEVLQARAHSAAAFWIVVKRASSYRASVVERSLLAHGGPEFAILAVLRELVGQHAWATVAAVTCEDLVAIGRDSGRARQGPRPCGRML